MQFRYFTTIPQAEILIAVKISKHMNPLTFFFILLEVYFIYYNSCTLKNYQIFKLNNLKTMIDGTLNKKSWYFESCKNLTKSFFKKISYKD